MCGFTPRCSRSPSCITSWPCLRPRFLPLWQRGSARSPGSYPSARTGAYLSDIAAEVGRRMVIVLIAALVAHAGGDPASQPWALLATAVMLASLDALSVPLVMAPM